MYYAAKERILIFQTVGILSKQIGKKRGKIIQRRIINDYERSSVQDEWLMLDIHRKNNVGKKR